jgi:hypothetical protein
MDKVLKTSTSDIITYVRFEAFTSNKSTKISHVNNEIKTNF